MIQIDAKWYVNCLFMWYYIVSSLWWFDTFSFIWVRLYNSQLCRHTPISAVLHPQSFVTWVHSARYFPQIKAEMAQKRRLMASRAGAKSTVSKEHFWRSGRFNHSQMQFLLSPQIPIHQAHSLVSVRLGNIATNTPACCCCSANRKAVSAYFTSKQILPFGFARYVAPILQLLDLKLGRYCANVCNIPW